MVRTPTRTAPPPAAPQAGGADGDYRLYRAAVEGLRRDTRRRLPPGSQRDAALACCRTLPWEHFEAKWNRLSADPAAAARYRTRLGECAAY